jgi:tyrosine-protein kinase Etk/Wzc
MARTTPTESAEKTGLDTIISILSILWRYRLVIVIATASVTLVTIAFCLVSVLLPPDKSPLPNVYSASATILVQENAQGDIAGSIVSAMGLGQNNQQPSMVRDNGDLVKGVLYSRILLDALTEEFDLVARYHIKGNEKGTSRKILEKRIQAEYTVTNGALKISYADTDPVLASKIVNKCVSLLESWFSQNRGLAKQKLRQSLEEKITEVKATIDTLQNRIKALQKQYGVLNAQELSDTQSTSLASLRSQLILKDVEIKNYTSFSKIDDPRLEQLKEERKNLLDLIEQTQQKLPESQTGDSKNGPKTLADVAQQFSQLNQELDIQQKIYNTLSPQYEAAKLAPESEAIFQVLELADVPDTKSGPKRTMYIAIAFMIGLLGSMGYAFLSNSLRKIDLRSVKERILNGGA